MSDLICLFSGRFDRPHIGHAIQIMRLGLRFKRVIIPILDYPEQKYPVMYRCQILKEALKNAVGHYEVSINREHFAHITLENLKRYAFDVYASGNVECLKHMESLGYAVEYIDRAFDYSASEER